MAKVRVETPLGDIVERFNTAFEFVEKRLINRSEEIEAAKYCLLTRGHLLLEGPPGVAKSLLARLVFKVVESESETKPLVVYRKQFMANTLPEEVFGPMNMQKLRADSMVEFNTAGMLPSAHFAYLDEIYRASDSMLPSMMGILNERTFHNGTQEIKCPLQTAIGTTNFITDRPELEAFHDRWLIRVKVRPADSPSARNSILKLFLQEEDLDDLQIPEPLTLTELFRLQRAIRNIELPDNFLELYEDLVSRYKAAIPGDSYVSDRRFCQASRLIQAAMMLEMGGENYERASASCVIASKYAILRSHDEDHRGAMDSAVSEIIGSFERIEKEEPGILQLEKQTDAFIARYDEKLPSDRKLKILERVVSILEKLSELPPDEQYTLPRNVERLQKCSRRLEDLKETLQSSLGIMPKTT